MKKEISNFLKYAKEKGNNEVIGPIGFCDLDKQGLLIEGFDQISMYITPYNEAYYPPTKFFSFCSSSFFPFSLCCLKLLLYIKCVFSQKRYMFFQNFFKYFYKTKSRHIQYAYSLQFYTSKHAKALLHAHKKRTLIIQLRFFYIFFQNIFFCPKGDKVVCLTTT